MSSELLNGDKIMPDGSKRTYVNGLVTFIAYPAGTTRAQMILPKEINRIEGVQVNSIVLPPPTYTSSYNVDDFQRAIDDGIRMASYQKASNEIPYAAGYNIDDYQKAKVDEYGDNGFNTKYNSSNLTTDIPNSSINYVLSPSEIASLSRTQDINLPKYIGTPSNYNSYQKEIDDGIKKATFNNLPDTASFGESSFISDNYILIVILSIAMIIMLVLVFVYKNKKSMNVENIIASFGLI
jgi:hypothetical protein